LDAGGALGACVADNASLVRQTVIAGTGIAGFSGDGGPADNVTFSALGRLALAERDPVTGGSPALLVVDSGNGVVRAITRLNSSAPQVVSVTQRTLSSFNSSRLFGVTAVPDRPLFYMLTVDRAAHVVLGWMVGSPEPAVVAGVPGVFGYNGDNITAILALLSGPSDVVWVAATSTYYIADTGSHRGRSVAQQSGPNTPWIIDTIAGSGLSVNATTPCSGGLATGSDIVPRALLYLNDTTRTWLLIADAIVGSGCLRALDLRVYPPKLILIAGGGSIITPLFPGMLVPALGFYLGPPSALTYDASSDAVIVQSLGALRIPLLRCS